jgi:hypothetical protein
MEAKIANLVRKVVNGETAAYRGVSTPGVGQRDARDGAICYRVSRRYVFSRPVKQFIGWVSAGLYIPRGERLAYRRFAVSEISTKGASR